MPNQKKMYLRNIFSMYINSFFFFADGCATPWIHPRKNVVCYFEGKRPISSLNVCLCTHLIYTDIGLNSYGQLDISNGKTHSAVDCLFPHLVYYTYYAQ